MDSDPRCPALSVLVLNHNYARFLPECLDSILSQSFDDYEVIVIDDASTDDSADVLELYERHSHVRIIRHELNRGFTASLVEGTEELSRGDFLTVISADDFALDSNAFALWVRRLHERQCLAACFGVHTLRVGLVVPRAVRHPL